MTDIQGLYLDYAPDGTEDDELLAIKERIAALDTPSKNIWLLYGEYGTYTAVARLLHCRDNGFRRGRAFHAHGIGQ